MLLLGHHNKVSTTRNSLSNISNIMENNFSTHRRSYTGIYENNFEDTTKKIFPESSSQNLDTNKYAT